VRRWRGISYRDVENIVNHGNETETQKHWGIMIQQFIQQFMVELMNGSDLEFAEFGVSVRVELAMGAQQPTRGPAHNSVKINIHK
jgi:hypothetical protein